MKYNTLIGCLFVASSFLFSEQMIVVGEIFTESW